MADPRRNVELKAVDPDPQRSLAICRKLGASEEGVLTQRDTYYAVARGRLKLREQRPGGAHLIQYERAARPEQRVSRYRIAEVVDAAAAHAALEAALGVECVVAKRRRLFLWRGVRIHLDEVEGLGSFVELEALAIDDARLVPHGYAQLMGHGSADDTKRLPQRGSSVEERPAP